MADSLFDNRYRYDYIYPRGRSGETLRAVDTLDSDRPVVIKRPAPQDAPPIRSGQEVSILNERKALSRLAGHPALTTLLETGQFFVSGQPHQYIVMERAIGTIIADRVLELAARGERLPELEMLVIVDLLLDLLYTAHAHDIVYNDVDAKHLFWDSEQYTLKVIDWGNAVFLEGDEITPQGISRQSDIFQMGELLYFLLTGGSRMEVPRDAGDDFRLDFGHDGDHIHTRLQAIISRAGHPNPRRRYASIAELRKDLNDYRAPIERERNARLGRIMERLRRELSKDELNGLLEMVETVEMVDPSYPPTRQARTEIHNRLSDLAVAADLDAARIYLESANWARAIDVLEDLRTRARGENAQLIALLLDWAKLLVNSEIHPVPPTIFDAITLLFEGRAENAARLLLLEGTDDEAVRGLQWLVAERISAHMSDIPLLRPSLYRLQTSLAALAVESITLDDARTLLTDVHSALDRLAQPGSVSGLMELRDGYRAVVDQLTELSSLLESAQVQYSLTNRRLPVTALTRAQNAVMALADNIHVIGKQATGNPRDARAALESNRAIDPANPAWDVINALLDEVHALLNAYRSYVPTAEGADLAAWLEKAQGNLAPYIESLFDEMLVSISLGFKIAAQAWGRYAGVVLQGNRSDAMDELAEAAGAISTVCPALAGWLTQLRNNISGAQYVERYALYGALGRALADGWDQFDNGRLAEAERLGAQAYEAAQSDAERFAARRLRELAEAVRDWVERSGPGDTKRTEETLTRIELLYTADEIGARDNFAAQMPSQDTFLRAMHRGIIDLFAQRSTAAIRILFFNYLLLGALEAQADTLDNARFWRDAAVKVLGEGREGHTAVRALESYVGRRHDLLLAAELLNGVNGVHALPALGRTREALEKNPQGRLLAAAIYSLREIEAAVRDWSDGEFRAAGIKLENALRSVDEVEGVAAVTLTAYRVWVMELVQTAAELHTQARRLGQLVEARPAAPDPTVQTLLQQQVETTTELLGETYAQT
ncbi:MAG: hypothetical protein GYB67_05170, partial [Chloroflexi bacterium]|nr:hypothetical protein [Chloroflexota bacterium]